MGPWVAFWDFRPWRRHPERVSLAEGKASPPQEPRLHVPNREWAGIAPTQSSDDVAPYGVRNYSPGHACPLNGGQSVSRK
jgi:hypothetical protein